MRWVCCKRLAGWLALAAMMLQLVLSFGHVHLDGIRGGPSAAVAADAKALGSQPSPAQNPADDGDNYCPICAAIHLASTSFLPDAPLLPVPFASQTVEHFSQFAFAFVAPQRTAFQSRAPPLA